MTKEERREYMKKWKSENKDKVKEYRHNAYLKSKLNGKYVYDPKKSSDNCKKWRQKNKDKTKEYQYKWRNENKEQYKAYQQEYKKKNREKWNAYQREYKKRKALELRGSRQ